MPDQSLIAERVGLRRMEVRAQGPLAADDVVALTRQLVPNEMGSGWELLVDLTGLSHFDGDTRRELQVLQRALAAQEVRTAFVADRPRLRGLALWLAHTADDPLARPFHHRDQAEAWLASREGRVQSITEYLERARTGRDREARETPSEKLERLRTRQRERGGGSGG